MTETKSATRPRAKPKAKARPARKTSARKTSKPKSLVDKSKAAGESVEETAKDAGHAVARAAGKAKVPLVAGGAALAGAAGGIALGARQAHRHKGLSGMNGKDVAKALRKAGDVGAQVGEVALEVKRARERTGGNGAHRSPIEVVLQGLTSRRGA